MNQPRETPTKAAVHRSSGGAVEVAGLSSYSSASLHGFNMFQVFYELFRQAVRATFNLKNEHHPPFGIYFSQFMHLLMEVFGCRTGNERQILQITDWNAN